MNMKIMFLIKCDNGNFIINLKPNQNQINYEERIFYLLLQRKLICEKHLKR